VDRLDGVDGAVLLDGLVNLVYLVKVVGQALVDKVDGVDLA
jgi:hypothetical protein